MFRSKSCKKELWSQINAALQANSKWHRPEVGPQTSTSFHRVSLEVSEEADLQQLPRMPIPTGICAYQAIINTGLPQVTAIANPEHILEPCVYPIEQCEYQQFEYIAEPVEYGHATHQEEEYIEIRTHPHINEQQQVEDNWVQNVNSCNPQNFSWFSYSFNS